MNSATRVSSVILLSVFALLSAASIEGNAQGPTFSKAFSPATIGPGSTSKLTFTITNPAGFQPMSDLAFVDDLPAGMQLADPTGAVSSCSNAALTASGDPGTISMSGGTLGTNESCTVTVLVVASETAENTSGQLSYDVEASIPGPSATLTVDSNLPSFTKSFFPETIAPGQTSTLTFTMDNTASNTAVTQMNFVDNLPTGMVVAAPANTSTTCQTPPLTSTVVANPGSSSVSFSGSGIASFPVLASGATCTVVVDVVAQSLGTLDNFSENLLIGGTQQVGVATATLQVQPDFLTKSFIADPVAPGGEVTLQFILRNSDRNLPATNIAFADPINPMGILEGLAPANLGSLPMSVCGGTLDFELSLEPTTLGELVFSGGSLAPEASCTIEVVLAVPTDAPGGSYTNTTGVLTAEIDGESVAANTASDILRVVGYPVLTKEFTDDPVGPGDNVTLEFTITNPNPNSSLNAIAFKDVLTTFLPFPVVVTLPPVPNPPCGGGSSVALSGDEFAGQGIALTGGTLDASGQCTFSVEILVPLGVAPGTYTNTTSEITALVGNEEPVTGPPASDDLVVVGGPRLAKQFTDGPAAPGGTVTLEFTLSHDALAADPATDIAFSDDLDAMLSGLVSTSGTQPDVCGTGSELSGTTSLNFSGGTLDPGDDCTFSVTLDVPAGATPGTYVNNTSAVTATTGGVPTTSLGAVDDLLVTNFTFTKEFTDDPVAPGGTVTLEFTLDNTNSPDDATSITFTDNIGSVLTDLVISSPPPSPSCGVAPIVAGSLLIFNGGTVDAGTSCSFSMTLQVPVDAAPDTYTNITSNLSATFGGSAAVLPPATDGLVVASRSLAFAKEFTNDPTPPGGAVNLKFTLTNSSVVETASEIAFDDDLEAMLSGLVALTETQSDICGTGSELGGTGLLTFTGGTLLPEESCTFSVTLDVPDDAAPGNYTNTTGDVTGVFASADPPGAPLVVVVNPVIADPATDDLEVKETVQLTMSIPEIEVRPGTSVDFSFAIENKSATAPGKTATAATDITFTLDLDGTLAGLAAQGLPIADVCGAGSQLSGTGLVTFTGGSVGDGGSCTFAVTVLVPSGAAHQTYPSGTSALRFSLGGGFETSAASSADLVVGIPLSVELSGFEAAVEGTEVLVSWNTESETNNAGFAVELSTDGVSFDEQAWVDGKGTTTTPQAYSVRFRSSAIGSHRIRLKQVDLDGFVEYSPTIEVALELDVSHRLSNAYPNPFNPSMAFTLTVAKEQKVRVALFDIMGREVRAIYSGQLAANQTKTFRLAANDLSSGVYIYRVTGDYFDESRRVMLVRGDR